MKFITIALGALLVSQAPAAAEKTASLRGSDASEERMKKSARYAAGAAYGSQQRFLKKHVQSQATTETAAEQIFEDLHPEFDVAAVNALSHLDEIAENAFELLFQGTGDCDADDQDGDAGNCSPGASAQTSEQLKTLAVNEIFPLFNKFAQAQGFVLTHDELYGALTLEATHDPTAIVDHDLVGLSDQRRLSGSCPKVSSNQCMDELKALTQSVLGTVYAVLRMPAADDVGTILPDQCFIEADWCGIEKWFGPLIDDNGRLALIANSFWSIGTLVPLHIYTLATSFTACGFQKFLSITYSAHRWYHMAFLGTIVVANAVLAYKTFGLSLAALIGLTLTGARLVNTKVKTVEYIQCVTAD